jgi:hypothetical protein
MNSSVDWDDVARFVGDYMNQNPRGVSGDLLQEIAEAYVKARGLPRSALVTVIQMVDSVL